MTDSLSGLGVSRGTAVGPVARMALPPVVAEPSGSGAGPGGGAVDPEAEATAVRAALEGVAVDLEARAGRAAGEAGDVLLAQAMMARDPSLAAKATDRVAQGDGGPSAVAGAFAEFRVLLAAAGPYLAERVADLDDIRNRVTARLMGLPMPGIPEPGHPFVLVAHDLAPADTATLDPRRVLAIVTESGGPTSHTAILAKQLGIPAVVSCPGAAGLSDGRRVLVDGSAGTVLTDPDEAVVAAAERAAGERTTRLAASSGPGRTADGHPVKLLVNVGASRDVSGPAAVDSEGVGLFRTEFCFLDRTTAPTVAEQVTAYRAVFNAFAGRKVVVRTLDAGADKPLPFLGLAEEANPALGVRGLRVARLRPDLLADQLAAIASAAEGSDADVWVMAPMVSTAEEGALFAAQAHAAGLPVAGAMVEVPAAALRADHLLDGVDFVSLGTNDLAQYTLAADRMAGPLADLLDFWQPALLQLVAMTAAAGRAHGKPVSVCGEAAGDPLLALVLVGLGVTSLSMASTSIAEVRVRLAAHSLAECERLAELATSSRSAAAARESVQAAADDRVRAAAKT